MRLKTTHDATITDAVFERIARGEYVYKTLESLSIAPRTFYTWIDDVPGLREQFTSAKEQHALKKLEEASCELDDVETEFQSGSNEFGSTYGQATARISKIDLKVKINQWWCSLTRPAMYGSKVCGAQNIKGADAAKQAQSLVKAINKQQITPADAVQVGTVLRSVAELTEIADIKQRLDALEPKDGQNDN